jgi:WD40 repeat protein
MSEQRPPRASQGTYDAFFSYSQKDLDYVRRVFRRLTEGGRKVWMDEANIKPGEHLPPTFIAAIEAAAVFVLFISPDSAKPDSWSQREFNHAWASQKKIVTVLYREIDESLRPKPPESLQNIRDIQNILWINGRETDDFDGFILALNEAIDADLEWNKAHARLLTRASEWAQHEYDESLLISGKELERTQQAIRAATGREPLLTSPQEHYLQASAAQQAKRSALSLAQQAEELLLAQPGQLQLGVLLAVESSRLRPNARATQVLRQGLARMPRPVMRLPPVGGLLAWGLGGKSLATVSMRAKTGGGGLWECFVQVWDMTQGRVLAHLPPDQEVKTAAFSADGARLLTMSRETIRLWEVSNCRLIAQATVPMGTAHSYALHPEGTWLAMSGGTVVPHSSGGCVNDPRFQGWSVVDGQEFVPWDMTEGLEDLVSSLDGRLLLGTRQERLVIREVSTGREVAIPLPESLGPRVLSADGRFLAVTDPDNTVVVYATADGQAVTRGTHSSDITALAFHPNGSHLVIAGEDQSLRVWAVPQGNEVMRFTLPAAIISMALSPDGHHLMTYCFDNTARVWQMAGGQETVRVADIKHASFSPDGRLTTHSLDGSVWQWEMTTVPEPLALLPYPKTGQPRDTLRAAAFAPSGGRLATAGADGYARLWDVYKLQELEYLLHETGVRTVTFDREGKQLGTLTQGWAAWVWNFETRQSLRLHHRDKKVRALAFSPDGRHVATGGDDNAVWIWELPSGNLVRNLPHESRVHAVSFSADGKRLATSSGPSSQVPFSEMAHSGDTASVWEVHSGQPLARVQHETLPRFHLWTHPLLEAIALSPDGELLATASADGTARLWTVPGGAQQARLQEHTGRVRALAFSPDGKYLATTDEQAARLWEVRTGRRVALLHHGKGVSALAFDPKGSFLATTCEDQTTRVWAVPDGLEVSRRKDNSAVGRSITFSPDAKCLATACSDDAVHLWFWEADWLLTEACARLTRNLSRDEWRLYFDDAEYRKTCPSLP